MCLADCFQRHRRWRRFSSAKIRDIIDTPDGCNSVLHDRIIPWFAVGLNIEKIPNGALSFIHTLRLSFTSEIEAYCPKLLSMSPHMTSLQEVHLEMFSGLNLSDLHLVFDWLLSHTNDLRVHAQLCLNIFDYKHQGFLDFFENFRLMCGRWTELNVESLLILIYHKKFRFPAWFLESFKGFTNLKRFSLRMALRPNKLHKFSEAPNCNMHEIPKFLEHLPALQFMDIECLDFQLPKGKFGWSPNPHLTSLRTAYGLIEMPLDFGTFCLITHLELISSKALEGYKDIKFYGLQTLALHDFGSSFIPTLEHFVSCNPYLVNLVVFGDSFSGDFSRLSKIFSCIRRFEVYRTTSVRLEDILRFSPSLRTLNYRVSRSKDFSRDSNADLLGMKRVVATILQNNLSPDLEWIHVQPLELQIRVGLKLLTILSNKFYL